MWVWSLVKELRSYKICGAAKKKKRKKNVCGYIYIFLTYTQYKSIGELFYFLAFILSLQNSMCILYAQLFPIWTGHILGAQ